MEDYGQNPYTIKRKASLSKNHFSNNFKFFLNNKSFEKNLASVPDATFNKSKTL